jgi:two-component system chemotaxis response regulator CheY
MPTILIADYDDDTRFIVRKTLEEMELDVVEANTPLAAHRLARGGVDAIVLNYPMQFADGVTLTRAIRADTQLASVPILNLTSHVTDVMLADAAADGVTCTLAKPVNIEAIVGAIRSLLQKQAVSFSLSRHGRLGA